MRPDKGRRLKRGLERPNAHDRLLTVNESSTYGAQSPRDDAEGHPVARTEVLQGKIVRDLGDDVATPKD